MKAKKKIHGLILTTIVILIILANQNQIYRKSMSNQNPNGENNIIFTKTPAASNFWKNFTFIHIEGNWSVIEEYDWCQGNGTAQNPYILENITIDATSSPTGSGIIIKDSKNKYFIIKNCTVSNAGNSEFEDAGIKLDNTNNGTLIDNNCSNNGRSGIYLENYCQNNTIIYNTLNDNVYGIQFYNNCTKNNITNNNIDDNILYGIFFITDCDNNTISENSANNQNAMGIRLESSSDFNIISANSVNDNKDYGIYLEIDCDNNTIIGNNASNVFTQNQKRGIFLMGGCDNCTISGNIVENHNWNGIAVVQSSGNRVLKNTANNNTLSGILINSFCEDNIISGNNITNNTGIGAHIQSNDCENNLVYNNTFIGNAIHAQDDSDPLDNHWDNGVLGNYWDNYTGTDWNDDAVGNIPYEYIGGSAGSSDNNPIWWDAPHIVIITPIRNMEYLISPQFQIEINCISSSMWYSLDGGKTNKTFTTNSTIDQTLWNQLEDGTNNITFYVKDTRNFMDAETIIILKGSFPPSEEPDISEYEDLINDLQERFASLLTISIVLAILLAIIGSALVLFLIRNSRKIDQLNQLIENSKTPKADKILEMERK